MSAAAEFPWKRQGPGTDLGPRLESTPIAPAKGPALAREAPETSNAEARDCQTEKLEAVGRLAGGVAHDFNNLLTGVMLCCDLLIGSLEPGHPAGKYAEEIRNAGMQATGLVKRLMAVVRPAASNVRPLLLNEIVEGIQSLLARLIGENIELRFHLDPDLGLVKMDATQAQQVLLNLVLNARDAMPGGGVITIETHNSRVQLVAEPGQAGSADCIPCVLFVVADNGKGMDDTARGHLFEPFFTTKAGKGTGLGLATVYDIVSGNGGLIHVDSVPGCGTRITTLLPLARQMDANKTYEIGAEKQEGAFSKEKE